MDAPIDLNVAVDPYLPDCLKGRLDNDFDRSEALKFDPASVSYYTREVLPAAIAGSVFAILALLSFVAMIIWISLNFCRCCTCFCRRCSKRKQVKLTSAASGATTDGTPTTQFITEDSKTVDAAPSPMDMSTSTSPKDPESGVHAATAAAAAAIKENTMPAWLKWLRWAILFIGTILVACSIWAIIDSLLVTNSQIDKFWDLVETVDNAQAKIANEIADLNGQVSVLKTATQQLNIESDKIQGVLSKFGDVGNTFSNVIGGLTDATTDTAPVQEGLGTAVSAIQENVGANIAKLKNKLKGPSLRFQNQGRVIVIVVIIGMIMLCALILTWLCWSVTMKHPIIASSFLAVMLFFIFIVLLFGSGVGKSMRTLSDDACMYSETYAAVTLLKQVKDPAKQKWLSKALDFYMRPDGEAGAPVEAGSAVSEVLGVNLKPIKAVVQSGALTKVLGLLDGPLAKLGLKQVLEPATVDAIGDLSGVVQPIANNIANMDELASRDTNHAIYKRAKSLMCCEGASAVARLYICWTIVGGFAFLFSALCFWRIVSQVRENRRLAKAGGGAHSAAGAAATEVGAGGDEVIKPDASGAVEVLQDALIPDQEVTTGTTTTTAV
ncbi:hypothetical protein Ndes2526B_g05949 [Nannochloris sp. 'desiccata']